MVGIFYRWSYANYFEKPIKDTGNLIVSVINYYKLNSLSSSRWMAPLMMYMTFALTGYSGTFRQWVAL
jgi:hypothetical protein